MNTTRYVAASALLSTHAFATEPSTEANARSPGSNRHVFVDELLGLRAARQVLAVGPGAVATSTYGVRGPLGITHARGRDGTEFSELWVRPALDFPIGDRWTVGGWLYGALRRSKLVGSSGDDHSIGGQLRVGYRVPLTDDLMLWPRLGPFASHDAYGGSGRRDFLSHRVGLEADCGLVTTLGKHALLSVGPDLSVAHGWSDGLPPSTAVTLGAHTTLGLAF